MAKKFFSGFVFCAQFVNIFASLPGSTLSSDQVAFPVGLARGGLVRLSPSSDVSSPFISTGVSSRRTGTEVSSLSFDDDLETVIGSPRLPGQLMLDCSFGSRCTSPAPMNEIPQAVRRTLSRRFNSLSQAVVILAVADRVDPVQAFDLYAKVTQFQQDNGDFLDKNGLLSDDPESDSKSEFDALLAQLVKAMARHDISVALVRPALASAAAAE